MSSIVRKTPKVETPEAPSWVAVYSGRVCAGHILSRGKLGVEAFNADDKSLGVYPNFQTAADTISLVSS